MHGVTGHNAEHQGVSSDFIDATFARRLRTFRERARMTQQELADWMAKTGNKFHRSTIGKIENGDQPVTIGQAVQLAGILGVPLEKLITEDRPQVPDEIKRVLDIYEREVMVLRAAQRKMAEAHDAFSNVQAIYDAARQELNAAGDEVRRVAGMLRERGHGEEADRLLGKYGYKFLEDGK